MFLLNNPRYFERANKPLYGFISKLIFLCNFKGRLGKREFLEIMFVTLIYKLALLVPIFYSTQYLLDNPLKSFFLAFGGLIPLGVVEAITIGTMAKRAQDAGLPGAWAFINLIFWPFVQPLFLFLKESDESNKWGPSRQALLAEQKITDLQKKESQKKLEGFSSY